MFSLDSFVNNTEGQGSNKLIIDGVFSNGAWVSLFGDRSSLIYTNFFKDEALGSENDRVNIRPSSSTHIAEYDWTSQPGLHNTRTILCRYYPKKCQIGKPQKKTVATEYQCSWTPFSVLSKCFEYFISNAYRVIELTEYKLTLITSFYTLCNNVYLSNWCFNSTNNNEDVNYTEVIITMELIKRWKYRKIIDFSCTMYML